MTRATPPVPRSASVERHGGLGAVLFDMDGTLVSTEETWLEVEHEVMARLGGPWGPEHQEALVGGSLDASVRYMLELSGSDVPATVVGEWLVTTMARHLAAGPVRWMPGARELLLEVRDAGLPTALVSASYRSLVDAVLAALGTDVFDVTVAGDEVTDGKPHPEPYVTAARRLGVAPDRCVVLEDSANGAASAVAAGCSTVVVPSVTAVPATDGLTVVESLVEVDLAWLRRLVDGQRRP